MTHSTQPAILVLEDGNYFYGYAFGATGTTSGEICFNTGMTGYQEVFTDPSYFGQVLIMNNVHVGNYGIKETDVESSSVKIRGLIGRNLEERFSRFQANATLQDYLVQNHIVAIEGIDTRALVSHIRQKGAMNCIISSDGQTVKALLEAVKKVPSMEGLELASQVSTTVPYFKGNPANSKRVSVLDFGIKQNILQNLTDRGVYAKVFPAKTGLQALLDFEPDGFFISNGPGDPASMDYAVATIQELAKLNKPMFGICLGHQLLALAHGIPTFKMHHGHRGLNHPVKNIISGRSEITTQNHGFGIDPEAVKSADHVEVTHLNLNDDSIEGIRIKDKPYFSVQYHPEATPGPHDSRYLFDQFLQMMESV
jgi:carbamoyl-phosphate synthase small subunit